MMMMMMMIAVGLGLVTQRLWVRVLGFNSD